jgi:peptide/nickel transport system permease protein
MTIEAPLDEALDELEHTAPAVLVPPPGTVAARRWLTPRFALRMVPILILILIVLFGHFIETFKPTRIAGDPSISPNGTYFFGTDSTGLDVYSRTIEATSLNFRIGLSVSVLTTVFGMLIGLAIGMNESRRGIAGSPARALARVIDLADAIPVMLVGVVALSLFGANVKTLIIALSIILIPLQARLVRTETLRIRSDAYLDAARLAGRSEISLTFRHVLPNAAWPALGNASVVFGWSCILTAALGFLGVGLPPPTAEWGAMIAAGASDASVGRWWSALFPTIALALAVVCVARTSRAIFGTTDDD